MFIGRIAFNVWLSVLVLVLLAAGIGRLQGRDVIVYGAFVHDNRLATNINLYDLQSGLSVVAFQHVHLQSMDVSADGRFLLLEKYTRPERELQVVAFATGTQHTIYHGDFDMARWSPDGDWVIYRLTDTYESGIYRIPMTGGTSEKIAPVQSVYALSADSKSIYYSGWGANGQPGIISRDLDRGEVTTLLTQDRVFYSDMSTSNNRIAFISHLVPYTFSLETETIRRLEAAGLVSTLAWSPDGERIAVLSGYTQTRTSIIAGTPTIVILNLDGDIVTEFSLPDMNDDYRIGWFNHD